MVGALLDYMYVIGVDGINVNILKAFWNNSNALSNACDRLNAIAINIELGSGYINRRFHESKALDHKGIQSQSYE